MKLFYNVLLVIFCINCGNAYAQEKPTNVTELAQSYSDYFTLNRESVFLHLNKTTVVPKEDIWFSAYVYNTKFQEPSLSTTNLHVNLYNSEGELMQAKILLIGNGKGRGHFALDSLYPPGKYLIKASTEYMENFREDLSYSQSFRIIGAADAPKIPIKYDLQLLPEGGHIVTNVKNTIGVKLIDNTGVGVFFTHGKVLNNEQEVVSRFKSNRFGLSKFSYLPEEGEKYTVVLTTENGTEIQKAVPQPEAYGITMSVNSLLSDKFIFSIRTNQNTFDQLESNLFFLVYHRDGKMKGLGFVIPKNTLEANIGIPKNAFFSGMNIVTVFNQAMKPVLERMVFNRNDLKRKHITADFKRIQGDSLIIGLKSANRLTGHSLSISVLPSKTKSYHPDNDILSAFYIAPYIKGNLENGSYYFSEKTAKRRRNYDLDLLLLTQGWSKYAWHNVFNNTPKEYFEAEHGFTIRGGVNNLEDEEISKVLLNIGGFFETVDLQEDGTFKLGNTYLTDSTFISVGLSNSQQEILSKPAIYLSVLPKKDNKSIVLPSNFGIELVRNEEVQVSKTTIIPKNFIKEAVSLDAVVLDAEVKTTNRTQEDFFIGLMYFDKYVVEESPTLPSTILGVIRMKGFYVRKGRGVAGHLQILNPRHITISGMPSPLLIIDGVPQFDYEMLRFMNTSQVKTLYINKSGGGYGMRGFGGVIRIKMKKSLKSGYAKKSMAINYTSNGFAPKKEFYAPKYISYTSPAFDNYGVIGWLPNVHLDKNGKTTIPVFNTAQPKINLYIEGMTAKGALISESITVKTSPEKP